MEKRDTEYLTRRILENNGYKHRYEGSTEEPVYEEQKSEVRKIQSCLSKASKRHTGEIGYPEFICSKANSDIVIVIECKRDIGRLKSSNLENNLSAEQYAVDGALWYASFLATQYHVYAIGVAGGENDLEIEAYYIEKNNPNSYSFIGNDILPFSDYETQLRETEIIDSIDPETLKGIADELNNLMRDEFKLAEDQKPLLVSAIFMALKDENFRNTYMNMVNSLGLATYIDSTVSQKILNTEIEQTKRDALISKYTFIRTTTNLISKDKWDKNNITAESAPLLYMVDKLDKECFRLFENDDTNIDVIGIFYSNFLRYTSSDGKGLGIVLTPTHITELFCDLANDGRGINPKRDIVVDPCAGTGGFLVAAMQHMINKAGNNQSVITDIKKNRIKGIESSDKMFALLSANMIVRNDGRSGVYYDNCFSPAVKKSIIKDGRPTVGLMNPPYSQKKSDESEYHFIENMLDMLEEGGSGIVIVPIGKACSLDKSDVIYKRNILKKHTLLSVMKLNIQLFGNAASTHTCIMVFEAHRPHDKETTPVWLANWSEDGYEVLKHRGRVLTGDWKSIKNQWLRDYRAKTVRSSYSTIANLDEKDEWIVDAHIDTDYSELTVGNFMQSIQDYLAFQVRYPQLFERDAGNEEGN